MNCLTDIYPQLRGWGEAPCRPLSVEAIAKSGASLAFLSTPHEASTELAPQLLAAGLRVVDLSGAFRFRDPQTFESWYQLPAPPAALLAEAVYGIPELYGDALAGARLVANPGCYPTSVILGLRPLVETGWIARERGIVCDCKSGASGAGKEPKRELQFVEVDENFRAYGLVHAPSHARGDRPFAARSGRGDVLDASAAGGARNPVHAVRLAEGAARGEPTSRRSTGSSTRGGRWCGSGRREACRSCSTWPTRISATSGLHWMARASG